MGANVLAAGHNLPRRAMTGSGIYQGHSKKQMVSAFETEINSKLLVATVEEQQKSRTVLLSSKGTPEESFEIVENSEYPFTSDKLENYTGLPIPKNMLEGTVTECNNGFCCNLTFSVAEKDFLDFHYQLLVFDGKRTHKEGRYETEMQVCALVACADDTKLSCTSPFVESTYSTTTVFDHIKIEAEFKSDYLWLNTLDSITMQPLNVDEYSFNVDENFYATMEKTGPITNVHTFGIYSHDYIF